MIALRNPMATDLRTVISVMKISANLERFGDYTKNLAKRTSLLVQMPQIDGAAPAIRRMAKQVEAMLKQLDKMERRTDKLATDLRGKLFKLEGELPPVDVMFYYQVLTLLGNVADEAEAVGDRLQVLMAK